MRLGRGITAARRQASRLAGLVRLPVCCRVKTAIRRQASWLAKKASVILVSRWPFALQKSPSCTEASQPARGKPAHRQLRGADSLFFCVAKITKPHRSTHPARGKPAPRQLRGKGKSAHSSALQKYPSDIEASQPARGKPAHRQLRGSRAAIGSGGKKARPF